MKRFAACILALLLSLALCGGALAEVTYPVTTEPLTVTVWHPLSGQLANVYTDLNDQPVYQEFERRTGIHLDFTHPAYGSEKEQFNLMIVNDDLPMLIKNLDSYYDTGVAGAYEDGLIYDLTPYIEQYAPDYYKLINSSDEARRQFYTEDGKILSFQCYLTSDDPNAHSWVVRKDWLDEFNIDPASLVTYDDFEVYLQAVLDNKPGVTPCLLSMDTAVWYWGYDTALNSFMNRDGKITHFCIDENYKAWLKQMNDWYEKGYIGVDFATVKAVQTRNMFSAGTLGMVLQPIGNLYSDAEISGLDIYKLGYPLADTDTQVHVYPMGVNIANGKTMVITTKTDESLLPILCQYLNYCYTEEGSLMSCWGPEGISWTYGENGEIVWADWVINNPDYGTAVTGHMSRLNLWPRLEYPETQSYVNVLRDEKILAARLQYPTDWDGTALLPNSVSLTADETVERGNIMTDCTTYYKEMRPKFITGEYDIDTYWDTYVKQLTDGLRLDDAIEITQNAWDRYVSR